MTDVKARIAPATTIGIDRTATGEFAMDITRLSSRRLHRERRVVACILLSLGIEAAIYDARLARRRQRGPKFA
ncbi:hypothetical protein F3J14_18105 [Burkholderia sp. Tr-862]|uniref:hypothetical protein n=1 Tax=Burkholderia sp. Tr-862 TaxID=2608331 RepID=UPI00141A0DA8|nr:hypothetical protein [Burkholderia sp. Tr-862]NIF42767.1 hypothetical protein [Burkholderia sp. Tr-862]